MKIKMSKLIALGLTLVLVSTSSCSNHKEKVSRDWVVQRDCAYFETKTLDISSYANDGSIYTLVDTCSKDGQIALILSYIDPMTFITKGFEAVFLDSEGNETGRLSLTSKISDLSVIAAKYDLDGKLAVLGKTTDNGVEILLLSSSGEQIEEIISIPKISYYLTDLIPTESGWGLLGYDKISLINKQGSILIEQPLEGESLGGQLFTGDSNVAVLVNRHDAICVLSIDPNSLQVTVTDNAEMHLPEEVEFSRFSIQGAYAIDYQGVYNFDFYKGTVTEIADWNRIDVAPSKYINAYSNTYVLDDDTMIRSTRPNDSSGSDELMIMKHRDKDPNDDKKVLTIGGYAPRTDLMNRAVYLYNTGDYDCRIEFVDYWDKYPYDDAAGLSRANAAFISDMSNGKGDDMFGGIEFNYDQLGDSGVVLDISELFSDDPTINKNDYLSCVTDLTLHNGKMFKIFPSFYVWGYVGYSEDIGTDNRLTINRVLDLAKDIDSDQMILTNASRTDLAINAIMYRFSDFVSEQGFTISKQELEELAEYADTYGIADNENYPNIDTNLSYVTGQLLLSDARISSPSDFNRYEQSGSSTMTYYGIPSIRDSARVCVPQSVIAISAGTRNKDACMDFIKVLLSDEVQQYAMELGKIPVSVDMFQRQITLAMTVEEPQAVPLVSHTNVSKPMTQESADQYRECVASVNCIQYVDIDLWNILRDEFESYYSAGNDLTDVRDSMISRVNLYLNENRN